MDISDVKSILQVVLKELPGVVSTAEQLVDLGSKFYESVNGAVPSPEQMVSLRASVDSDVALALTPLPPAVPGDPDYTG